MPNSKKENFPSGTHPIILKVLGPPTPKIQIWFPIFSPSLEVSENMSCPCWIKTQGGDSFRRNGSFSVQGTGGQLIWDPCQKLTGTELDWSSKCHQNMFIPSKVIQLFFLRTDTHPPIHTQKGEFLNALFTTCYCAMFVLFVKYK